GCALMLWVTGLTVCALAVGFTLRCLVPQSEDLLVELIEYSWHVVFFLALVFFHMGVDHPLHGAIVARYRRTVPSARCRTQQRFYRELGNLSAATPRRADFCRGSSLG